MGRGIVSPEKGGALRTTSTAGRRVALATLFTGILLAAPLLLLAGQGQASSAPSAQLGSHADGRRAGGPFGLPAQGWRLVRFGTRSTSPPAPDPAGGNVSIDAVSTTTAVTSPPPPSTTTTAPPPSTTTTAPPPSTTTTAPAPAPPGQSATGVATWYAAAPPGDCASPWLPFGTVLEVVDDASGARTSCTVDDREADNPGRVVDLSYDGFSQLEDPSLGVVTVTVSW